MKYEVELKYSVDDLQVLQQELISLGATVGERQIEVDLYFAHPSRDYSKTDEAVRIRRKGSKNYITYKGPKVDTTTKTRCEIELPLQDGEESAQGWTRMLEALGFSPVGEVCKSRRKMKILWQEQEIECSLDEVQGLGIYCELELIADKAGMEAAKACIASLAEKLGLKSSERRSYLELLMG